MKIAVLSLGVLALCGATALPAIAAKPGPKPKLTMAQARIIALKRAPGKIKDAEYEQEKGGWRYSFDIVQANRIHEIGVDAMTGAIVEDIYEAPGAKD
ncbi:MAG: PepSY domain-containing protein [Pseudomonadota bacterium]|uniref:PepSY domain-containing protein n=1 Tax=Sphingomonas sp. ERG5 TaxID=1381597 RepID=UPI00054BF6D6|nr:PepSY domain-containing protein [Sphingomonas sp. ERG5]